MFITSENSNIFYSKFFLLCIVEYYWIVLTLGLNIGHSIKIKIMNKVMGSFFKRSRAKADK